MKLLLDTCTLLWLATDSPKLSARAREACADTSNDLYVSVVSSWEIAIKHSLGKLVLHVPPGTFMREERERLDADRLPLRERAVFLLSKLPHHHRDPFDRMLVCQAIAHDLVLVTSDSDVRRYAVRTLDDA